MLAYYTPKPITETAIMAQLSLKSPWATRDYITAMRNFSARKTIQIISKIREIDARSKGLDNANTPPGELLKELISFILHWHQKRIEITSQEEGTETFLFFVFSYRDNSTSPLKNLYPLAKTTRLLPNSIDVLSHHQRIDLLQQSIIFFPSSRPDQEATRAVSQCNKRHMKGR